MAGACRAGNQAQVLMQGEQSSLTGSSLSLELREVFLHWLADVVCPTLRLHLLLAAHSLADSASHTSTSPSHLKHGQPVLHRLVLRQCRTVLCLEPQRTRGFCLTERQRRDLGAGTHFRCFSTSAAGSAFLRGDLL